MWLTSWLNWVECWGPSLSHSLIPPLSSATCCFLPSLIGDFSIQPATLVTLLLFVMHPIVSLASSWAFKHFKMGTLYRLEVSGTKYPVTQCRITEELMPHSHHFRTVRTWMVVYHIVPRYVVLGTVLKSHSDIMGVEQCSFINRHSYDCSRGDGVKLIVLVSFS